jgi:hypothetical protein
MAAAKNRSITNLLIEYSVLTLGSIEPWLVAGTIREPTVGATDGDVQDEVEWPIEGCRVAATFPWVLENQLLTRGGVGNDAGEVSTLEEGLVEGQVEGAVETRVDIDPHKVGGPFNGVIMETLVERLAALEPPAISPVDGVDELGRTPVERAANIVDTLSRVLLVITASLHNLKEMSVSG